MEIQVKIESAHIETSPLRGNLRIKVVVYVVMEIQLGNPQIKVIIYLRQGVGWCKF